MPKLSVDQLVESDDRYTARDFFTWDLPLAILLAVPATLLAIVFGPYLAGRWVVQQVRKMVQR